MLKHSIILQGLSGNDVRYDFHFIIQHARSPCGCCVHYPSINLIFVEYHNILVADPDFIILVSRLGTVERGGELRIPGRWWRAALCLRSR